MLLELDDAELINAAFVGRAFGAVQVDLRERTEGALAGDGHLVAALHLALDFSLNRQAAVERVLELTKRGGAPRQLARQRQAAGGRDHHRLDAFADHDLDIPVGVLQLRDVDRGLALATDVDERHLRPDGDDGPLDGLPSLEALRFQRSFEHGGEIVFRVGQLVFSRAFQTILYRIGGFRLKAEGCVKRSVELQQP